MRPPRGKMSRNLGAALLAGLACGGLWILFATTIMDVVRPGVMTVPVTLGVGGVMGLAVAAFCWRPGPPRQIWGRVALTVGLHTLALPVAAAISFGATGIWPPPETADLGLSLDVFGVRLVGSRSARPRSGHRPRRPTSGSAWTSSGCGWSGHRRPCGSGSAASSPVSSSSRSAIEPCGALAWPTGCDAGRGGSSARSAPHTRPIRSWRAPDRWWWRD